jgi:nucleotide-binding universal stress UspA family protein
MELIRNIVVPTDFSPLADAACERAASLARLFGAAIHLVHAPNFPLVTAGEGSVPPNFWDDLRQAAKGPLEQARKRIEARGVQLVTAKISDALDAVHGIAEAVDAERADLVVMGTHGRRGISHAFLGSVAERTLRTVDTPVLAVKEDPETAAQPIEKILLAVDFSPHSERSVEWTASLAGRLKASVEVLHAFDLPPDYNPYVSEFGADLERRIEAHVSGRLGAICDRLAKHGIRANARFGRGRPDAVIAHVAREIGCQLIAMGTRGQSGVAHVLLGSVAERTLRAAPCSVLCVKASDAVA